MADIIQDQSIQNANKPAPTSAQQANKGSGFTNLQSVIGANQNNQLGQAVSSGVTNQANQAKSSLQQSQNQFQQGVQSSDQALQQNNQKAQNTLQQVGSNGYTPNSQDTSNFQNVLSGQYTGPQGLQNQQQLTNQAGQAQQLGGLVNNASGRQALLQTFVGGGAKPYTSGQQTLDNLLLGQGSNNAALNQAARATQGLTQNVQDASTAAQQAASTEAGQYKNVGNALTSALTNQATGLDTTLQNLASQDKATQQATMSRLQGELANGAITQSDLDSLGLKAGDISNLYGTNIANFLSATPEATAQSVATQQQAAQLAALGQLAGNQVGSVAALGQQYSGPNANIGGYTGPISFDANAAKGAISQQQAAYNQAVQPYQGAQTNDVSGLQHFLNNMNAVSKTNDWRSLQDIQSLQKAGIDINDPNAAQKLAQMYDPNNAASNFGKNITEGIFGNIDDSNQRDQIKQQLTDYYNNQNQINQQQQQFGFGKTLQILQDAQNQQANS